MQVFQPQDFPSPLLPRSVPDRQPGEARLGEQQQLSLSPDWEQSSYAEMPRTRVL